MTTERSPLLGNVNSTRVVNGTSNGLSQPAGKDPAPRLGPLEISAANRRAILAGIWIATFLSSLNTTLVATLVSSISSEYQKSNQASWLGTSYLLATCTFTPLYGRLCNVMGRRGANQTAVLFAGIGTLCCGFSSSLEMLIAARFLSGLGGGGIFTTATVITSDMYTMRERGLTQGIAAIFNGLGMGFGGPIGGFISDRFGWRWAFLIQVPLFVISFILTGYNLRYVTPGKGKGAKDVLKRIDYGGSFTLLTSMGALLFFLSYKYNDEMAWNSPAVLVSLCLSIALFVVFVLIELLVAPEPVLAPFLLRQKVPVLIGMNNLLVSMSNFSVMYFFPMFFETVMLTSASTAGLHLLPNSTSMSCGSLFAGWVMHRTGRYRTLDLVFGLFPFLAGVLLTRLTEQSGLFAQWFSIIPLGFGNAVVLQTTLIALLMHVDYSAMAIATGFGQLWRGIGQVCGVAVPSAIFQSLLDRELKKRIHGPGASETVRRIRHSSRLVASLPPDLQRAARDSYAISLRMVFVFSACAALLSFLVRLPVPDKPLDEDPRNTDQQKPSASVSDTRGQNEQSAVTDNEEEALPPPAGARPVRRRLSTYESTDGGTDLEDDMVGSARR